MPKQVLSHSPGVGGLGSSPQSGGSTMDYPSPQPPPSTVSPRNSSSRNTTMFGNHPDHEGSTPPNNNVAHRGAINAGGYFFGSHFPSTASNCSRNSNPPASSNRRGGGGNTTISRDHHHQHRLHPQLNLAGHHGRIAGGGGPQSPLGSSTAPHLGFSGGGSPYFPAPAGILPELAVPQTARGGGSSHHHTLGTRSHREHHRSRVHHCGGGRLGSGNFAAKGGSLVPSPPPASLNLITSVAGDPLLFSETNMDWTKLNIFRTRLCDRLTQTHNCHMANRCLFSHDVNWPRRTPFLPRATALTLRYIPVWCPRLSWPPLVGFCDSSGKISWTAVDETWNARLCHQQCTRGDNCPFVHNVEEFLYHPEVYKTRSCCLANDDNFEEQLNSNCVALCPWYFCPFAHDVYELRNLRESRYAWHPPPQIVDDDHVARTQDFDGLEKKIIEFVRRSPNGSLDLYASPESPLSRHWRERMPPVVRPIIGSSLEQLIPSAGHRHSRFDDLLHLMVVASFLNLLLYPVENFYVPTLLSLQCAILQSQLGLLGQAKDCASLIRSFFSKDEKNDQASTPSPRFSDASQIHRGSASDDSLKSPRLIPDRASNFPLPNQLAFPGLSSIGETENPPNNHQAGFMQSTDIFLGRHPACRVSTSLRLYSAGGRSDPSLVRPGRLLERISQQWKGYGGGPRSPSASGMDFASFPNRAQPPDADLDGGYPVKEDHAAGGGFSDHHYAAQPQRSSSSVSRVQSRVCDSGDRDAPNGRGLFASRKASALSGGACSPSSCHSLDDVDVAAAFGTPPQTDALADSDKENEELQAILGLLKPEELAQMIEFIASNTPLSPYNASTSDDAGTPSAGE